MKNYKKNSGFTLIELMVATSLFVVIMLSALSALFMLLDESKNSRALRLAMDNVNFAMESMTRSIRMGSNYYCGSVVLSDLTGTLGCPSGGDTVSFVPQPQGSDPVSYRTKYRFENNTLKRYDAINQSGISMISPDVKIESLKFFVKVPDINNMYIQPSVYIIMRGTVTVKGVPTYFAVQTLASQRNFK